MLSDANRLSGAEGRLGGCRFKLMLDIKVASIFTFLLENKEHQKLYPKTVPFK